MYGYDGSHVLFEIEGTQCFTDDWVKAYVATTESKFIEGAIWVNPFLALHMLELDFHGLCADESFIYDGYNRYPMTNQLKGFFKTGTLKFTALQDISFSAYLNSLKNQNGCSCTDNSALIKDVRDEVYSILCEHSTLLKSIESNSNKCCDEIHSDIESYKTNFLEIRETIESLSRTIGENASLLLDKTDTTSSQLHAMNLEVNSNFEKLKEDLVSNLKNNCDTLINVIIDNYKSNLGDLYNLLSTPIQHYEEVVVKYKADYENMLSALSDFYDDAINAWNFAIQNLTDAGNANASMSAGISTLTGTLDELKSITSNFDMIINSLQNMGSNVESISNSTELFKLASSSYRVSAEALVNSLNQFSELLVKARDNIIANISLSNDNNTATVEKLSEIISDFKPDYENNKAIKDVFMITEAIQNVMSVVKPLLKQPEKAIWEM